MTDARPTNWNPPNWDPGNWFPPVNEAPAVFVAVRAAFLDRFGRFAKREEDVAEVRLWAEDAEPGDYVSMTVAVFNAKTASEREAIRNLGSGAGYVVTEGKSNA